MDRPIHPHPPLHSPVPPTPFDTAEYQPAEVLGYKRIMDGIRAPLARPLSEHPQAINAGANVVAPVGGAVAQNPQSAFARPVPQVVQTAKRALSERFRSGGFLE